MYIYSRNCKYVLIFCSWDKTTVWSVTNISYGEEHNDGGTSSTSNYASCHTQHGDGDIDNRPSTYGKTSASTWVMLLWNIFNTATW